MYKFWHSVKKRFLSAARARRALRYALETRDFRIDLWYSPSKEWLALESRTESGRTIRYQIQ